MFGKGKVCIEPCHLKIYGRKGHWGKGEIGDHWGMWVFV